MPQNLKADNGVTLKALPDGSVLAGGALPPSSMFEVTADSRLKNITAFRMELIPDDSLPDGGSGRGAGGKGVVTLFEVRSGNKKVDLSRVTADFKSEESELNLVIRPSDQLKRGWGVNPEVNKRHYAVIETSRMFSPAGAMTFRVGNEYADRAVPDFGDGFGVSGSGAGGDGCNSADAGGGAFGERQGGADEVLRIAPCGTPQGE